MYVCMYVGFRMYDLVHVCICASMSACMCICMYVCMYGCIDVQRRRGPFASEADDFFTDILVVYDV